MCVLNVSDEDEYYDVDKEKDLNEENDFATRLFDLSERMGNLSDIRGLGIKGLKMSNDRVEKHINNSPHILTSAAYNLLPRLAPHTAGLKNSKNNMIKALRDSGRDMWISIFSS